MTYVETVTHEKCSFTDLARRRRKTFSASSFQEPVVAKASQAARALRKQTPKVAIGRPGAAEVQQES